MAGTGSGVHAVRARNDDGCIEIWMSVLISWYRMFVMEVFVEERIF